MSNILSSFMTRQVAEGQMVSFTYSIVDEEGNFLARKKKGSFLVTDENLMEHINAIEGFILENKLSGGE